MPRWRRPSGWSQPTQDGCGENLLLRHAVVGLRVDLRAVDDQQEPIAALTGVDERAIVATGGPRFIAEAGNGGGRSPIAIGACRALDGGPVSDGEDDLRAEVAAPPLAVVVRVGGRLAGPERLSDRGIDLRLGEQRAGIGDTAGTRTGCRAG